MRIVSKVLLGQKSTGPEWMDALREVEAAIRKVCWPEGSREFTIYPESGKKRDEGNGVKPMHQAFLAVLSLDGWKVASNPLRLDAVKTYSSGRVGLEWETGNISSSHRSLNRLQHAQMSSDFLGGILILPTRKLARFLTDRIGNFEEIEPYLYLYDLPDLALMIYAIEHDRESFDVPRIKKGTDGRSLL